MKWHVYILRCSDGSLYTGVTTDLQRRIREHNETSRGAKYTRSRRPVTLCYSQEFPDRSSAQSEECRIKKLKRSLKLELIGERSNVRK